MRAACVLAVMAALIPGPAFADPVRDQVMGAALRCEGIADNRAWLDCFYGSAQPMRALLGLSPAPQAQTKLVPEKEKGSVPGRAATARPQRRSGFLADILGSTKPVVSDMPMSSYNFAPNHTFTVTLRNGLVYQQEESDLTFAGWTRPAADYHVTITASADKYVLRVKEEPGAYFHVRRR